MPDEIPSDEMHGLDPAELLARGLQTARRSSVAGGWTPPTAEKVARLLPQYGIESLIGRGGMGAVYKGVQRTLDRAVAIKLLPAEVAADAQFVTRFEREARTLAKLQHSRIVTIHDFGRTSEGHLYFVMEYIDGTNLRSILRGPGLDPEQALAVVGQLCDALQAAHRAGVIHRDIKPENVLVTTDGYVKLADFGLARPPQEDGESGLTQTNVVMGTPDYMAPEQRAGANKADHRSDIFALGVMFYEMLTGETPHGVFDPPSRRMQIDVRIDDVVLKALQSAPDRRYQKASEMKTDVEQIQSGPPAPAAPATPPPQAPAKAKGARGIMIAAAALGAVLVAGGIIFFLSRKGGEASRHQSTESLPGTPAPSEEVVKSRPPEDALHTTQNRDNTPSPATPAPAIQQAKLETPKPTVVAMVVPKIETPSAAKQTTPVPVATATPDPDRTRFEEALVSHAWSWNAGTNNAREAELTFRRDGSAICAGTAGQWTISDRRKVALSFNGAKIGLTFGESVQSFSAISEGPQTIVITGAAKGPAASTPTVPPVALAPTPKVEATPTPPPST
ncbi:MAG: protein kinase, partial [Chthoniobacter sp.]|uniref:serine/threonine-protein kinase n=1 Tax=Chthoniobacter sp. TaxID=2510640 RepID=UPI0032A8C52A